MDKSKILLFIVEGPSDEAALAPALEEIVRSSNVKFKVMHADITCDYDSTVDNIEKRIKKLAVKRFLNENPQFSEKDICGLVHIVDLDGAFAPDGVVTQDDNALCNLYYDDSIICKDKEKYLQTKHNKAQNLIHLAALKEISIPNGVRVPYSIYFMSCNLDHVLHDKRNSTREEKKENSLKFSDEYDDPQLFEEFFNQEGVKVVGTYEETWRYIQQDYNSLLKGSNLWICIDEHKQI